MLLQKMKIIQRFVSQNRCKIANQMMHNHIQPYARQITKLPEYNKFKNSNINMVSLSALFAIAFPLLSIVSSENSNSCSSCNTNKDSKKDSEKTVAFDKALLGFQSCLQENQIELDVETLKAKGKPWSSYHSLDDTDAYPRAILYPETTLQVSLIMKICHEHSIPVIPYGGGTSLEGQILTPEQGISLDFNRMKKIVKINEQDMDITVEAGLGYVELNEQLASKGLIFPLDPGPGASIGGMISCRCSGSTAVRYGSMRENILSMKVVTSDGSIVVTGARARKSSAGYDIARLMTGSEGTLGVVTEATLRLRKIPKHVGAIRISFRNGIKDAALFTREIINNEDVIVNRCEFMDDNMMHTIKMTTKGNHFDLPSLDTLLLEIVGSSDDEVRRKVGLIKDIAVRFGGSDVTLSTDPVSNKELWQIRKEALWSSMAAYPEKDIMITDVCVPLSNFPTIIEDLKKRIKTSMLPCPMVAHAGDGNIHVFIMFDSKDPVEHKEADDLHDFMVYKALELEGTCTGEHGIGYGKIRYLNTEYTPATLKMMSDIKVCLDPKNILNPGKVIGPDYIRASQESRSCNKCKIHTNKTFCG